MSWHFLQEQGEACWQHHNLDGAPDALLKLIPTLGNAYWHGNGTEYWNRFQYGTISELSKATTGEDQLTSSAVDSHAKTYLPLDGGGY